MKFHDNDAENSLCAPVPLNQISETEFWVKQKRIAILVCQQRGTQKAPEKLCVPTRRM